jgi:hypothetical protein
MREVRLDEDKTGVFGVVARNPTGPFQVHRLRLVKRAALSRERKGSRMRLKPTAIAGMSVNM